jgi:hypothetical protein
VSLVGTVQSRQRVLRLLNVGVTDLGKLLRTVGRVGTFFYRERMGVTHVGLGVIIISLWACWE